MNRSNIANNITFALHEKHCTLHNTNSALIYSLYIFPDTILLILGAIYVLNYFCL